MPRGGGGGGGAVLKLRFHWYKSETFVYIALVLCVHYDICRFMFTVSSILGSIIGCFNVNPSAC